MNLSGEYQLNNNSWRTYLLTNNKVIHITCTMYSYLFKHFKMYAITAMDWDVEPKCVAHELFPPKEKLDRGPVSSENRYSVKTLVGNWIERRATSTPRSDDWRSLYEIDYVPRVNETWETDQAGKWENKLVVEGLPRDEIFDHKTEYYDNMTTTNDLCYNVLPKGLKGPKPRSYNARLRKWLPEQDLLKSFGTLTQSGLREAMREELEKNSLEGIAKCRWWSTYREEIGLLRPANVEYTTQFRRRKVDFNEPDLRHLKRKSAFAAV
ncbi:uncharacterized protein C1orf158-like [Ceratina calcarata]|uniref:Uncharacterized protein C1orf158-like n=1 Tax=Ceratina calcarata TaxID=156304 RepID=A0AAJ7JEB6_9HYME|nr:uncharacterized protein C1orf158-like [Ceratina calcarata]